MKNNLFLRSMRARMTLGFATVIGLLMLLVCVGVASYLHYLHRRAVEELLDISVREIGIELRGSLKNTTDPTVFMEEGGEEMRDRNLALFVVDRSGRVLAQSQKHIPAWPRYGNDWIVRRIPFGAPGTQIILAAPWRETEKSLRESTLILSAIGILVVVFSSLGAWVLVGQTLSPIGKISHQAATASDEGFVQLEAPSEDAEVVGLVETLNDLLARQAQVVRAKGRFYAAASHELRTPLQALSGFLEMGLSRERSHAELRATLLEAQEQSRQLVALTQDLLLLNQLDMATAAPPVEEIDVPDVIERILKQLEPEIRERALHVQTDWPAACEITAPWNHVEMLVRNLIENAVKYATPGGGVRVGQEGSTLTVWNQCAPIEGWDQDKCFEPFYRPDTSRNSQTGGNGLGLAICKAVCDANRWTITVRQTETGVLATVIFEPGQKE